MKQDSSSKKGALDSGLKKPDQVNFPLDSSCPPPTHDMRDVLKQN